MSPRALFEFPSILIEFKEFKELLVPALWQARQVSQRNLLFKNKTEEKSNQPCQK